MAKNSTTIDGNDNDNSRFPLEEEKFEQSREDEVKKYPAKKVKNVFLKHNRNTKKELHIGRTIYTFWGSEGIEVPKEVVEHPDFENQRKYFLIKEV